MRLKQICRVLAHKICSKVLISMIIVSINVIIWILSNFSFTFNYLKFSGQQSILQTLGKIIAPIFMPLGFGTWGASSAIIAGLIAKETVISSIAIFNGVSLQNLSSSLTNISSAVSFTPASAISFMVFCLLYTPCLATLGILKKEIGTKWFAISLIIQFIIAYFVSFLLFNISNIIINKGILFFVIIATALSIMCYAVYFLLKKKNFCKRCNKCKK